MDFENLEASMLIWKIGLSSFFADCSCESLALSRLVGGYGSNVLNTMRRASKLQANLVEFPVIPGRDFAGTVVDVGRLTRGLRVGDRVYGTPAPHWQGSHAEYVLAPSITVS
jgi:hypothetical protein